MRLERVCGRFENAWEAAGSGTGPCIEDYLAPAPGEAQSEGARDLERLRPALLHELVQIDLEYRYRAGQAPGAEEYLSRFPALDRDWLAGALAAALARGGPPRGTSGPPAAPVPGGSALTQPTLPPVLLPPRPLPAPFDDYVLLEEVARGGMGVVYKARQLSLNRVVALKMILPYRPLSEEAVARFRREAQAAAALDHPNIVAVHASGQHEGRPFFSMAFVEGDNLREVVRRDGLPAPGQAADWLRPVAEAVAFAHRRGILHRDLKPENVLLDRQGRPRVTDFGLACPFEAPAPPDRLTHTGQVLGTPAYMAPEQALGRHEAVGPATDVYGLGGILYFLLTGQAPFLGRSVTDVLLQVTTQAPTPPRELNPQASADLQAVCLRCLEKDPARRFPSAEALSAALRDAALRADTQDHRDGPARAAPTASGQMVVQPPTPALTQPSRGSGAGRRRWSRRVWLGLAAVVLAGVAVGLWLALGPSRSAVEWRRPPQRLRADFGLTVAMLDKQKRVIQPGADGILQLRASQELQFRVKVDEDAYVGIWSVNSDGTVVQLFPNAEEKDHHFRKGEERLVPQTRDGAEAEQCEGETEFDWVWVQASTRPWDPDQGQRVGPFDLFKTDRERAGWARQRGAIRLRSDVGLAEAVLKFRVGPR
jgi:serine/threonine protein kinase